MAHGWVPTPESLLALAYGGGKSLQPPLAFIDDHLAYIAGRALVFQSISSNSSSKPKPQSFLMPKTSAYSTLAFCFSNDNQLLVTVEAGHKSSLVVYEAIPETATSKLTFKRKKVISQIEIASKKEALALDLSFDTKYLALFLPQHQPQGLLTLYLWRTSKVVASIQLPPPANFDSKAQVLFHPTDVNSLTVLWSGQFKIWRLTPDGFEQGPKIKYSPSITCQAWLSSLKQHHLLLGTVDGQILVVQEGDIAAAIKLESVPILSLCCLGSTRFVCAFMKEDRVLTVGLFGSTDAKNTAFELLISWPIYLDESLVNPPNGNIITNVVTNNNGTHLAVCASGKLTILDLTDNLPVVSPMAGLGKEIRSLNFSAWKPQFLTLSGNNCWTVWDYSQIRIQMQAHATENVVTCAIHPSGHYLVYSTQDALILAAMLVDKFHVVKEIRQRFDHVVCSPGGHMVALAHQNNLQLFHYSHLNLTTLPCNLRAEIKCLAWVTDGSLLYASFSDGSLLQFDPCKAILLLQWKLELVLTTITFGPSQSLIVVDGKGSLFELDALGAQVLHEITIPETSIVSIELLSRNQDESAGRAVLAATSTGALRVYTYPFTARYEYHEYFTQSSPITKMGVSYDKTTLVSCGADGSICLWRFGEMDKQVEYLKSPLESLVLRDEWYQYLQKISQLKHLLEEAQHEYDYRLRRVQKDLNERFLSEEVRHNQVLVRLTKQNQELEEKLNAKDLECLKCLEAKNLVSKQETKSLTENYETKLASSYRRYLGLEKRFEEAVKLHEQDAKALKTSLQTGFDQKLAKIQADADGLAKQLGREKEELAKRLQESQMVMEEQRKTSGEETKALQKKYDRFLSVEKQVNLKLRSEAGVMRKSIASLQRDLEGQKQNGTGQQAENQRLAAVILEYQRSNAELKEDLAKRDSLVKSKDDKLRHLSRLLEQEQAWRAKHESELNDVIQAKKVGEIFITDLRATLEEKEKLVKRFERENLQSQRSLKDLQGKAQVQKESIRVKTLQIQTLQKNVANWKQDLDVGVAYVHDYPAFKHYFMALHELHCKDAPPEVNLANQGVDWPRKYALLEQSFLSLKHQLAEQSKTHSTIKQKLLQDNSLLLKQWEKLEKKEAVVPK